MTQDLKSQKPYSPPDNLYSQNARKRRHLSPPLQGPSRPIRHIRDRKAMRFEYDLWGTRLHPWEEAKDTAQKTGQKPATELPAPFGGAWCLVEPGTYSLPHQHEEREMFICVEGEAFIVLDGEHKAIQKGDLIAIPPETEHYIDNSRGRSDFHFFTVWWDEASARDFLAVLQTSPKTKKETCT